jgi:hypothetical protein
VTDLTAETEALRESLGLGAPFHVGIATRRVEDGMEAVSALFGTEWAAVRVGAEPGLSSPEGPVDWQTRVAHSKQGPLRLELLEGSPGSIWATDAVAELHHVAFWSFDVPGDVERLERGGWSIDLTFYDDDGNPFSFAYMSKPGNTRIELVDVARREAMFAHIENSSAAEA